MLTLDNRPCGHHLKLSPQAARVLLHLPKTTSRVKHLQPTNLKRLLSKIHVVSDISVAERA